VKNQDKLGLWQIVSLVTGNLVGSGVFLLPATLAVYGTVSLFGWIFTSIGAIFLALVFADLSSRIPKTGGPHTYVGAAFGETASFYVAWGYWILSWTSNAGLTVAAVGYLSSLWGGFSLPMTLFLEISLICIVAGVNLLGIQITGKFGLIVTILKLLPLLIVPVVGIFFIEWEHFYPINRSVESLPTAINSVALLTLWAFIGLETGTVPGAAVVNPRKTIPRATIIGTLIAAVVYILGTFVIMGVIPPDQLAHSKAPYADIASIIFGGSWNVPIAIAAVISCLGALNGWTLIVGQIALGASNDKLFPKIFGKLTAAGAPKWGVIISSACSIPIVIMSLSHNLVHQFNFIIEISVTLILLIYTVCVFAYLSFLRQEKTLSLKKIILVIFALTFSFWALWAASFKMVLLSLSIIVCGIPMRLWMTRSKAYTKVS